MQEAPVGEGSSPGTEEYGGVSPYGCSTQMDVPVQLLVLCQHRFLLGPRLGTKAFPWPSPCPAACGQCYPPFFSPTCCSFPLLAAFNPSRLLRFHLLSVLLTVDLALVVLLVLWAGVRFLRREKCRLRVAVKLELLPLTWTLGAVVRGPTIRPTEVFPEGLMGGTRSPQIPSRPRAGGLCRGQLCGASGLSEGRSRSPPS